MNISNYIKFEYEFFEYDIERKKDNSSLYILDYVEFCLLE